MRRRDRRRHLRPDQRRPHQRHGCDRFLGVAHATHADKPPLRPQRTGRQLRRAPRHVALSSDRPRNADTHRSDRRSRTPRRAQSHTGHRADRPCRRGRRLGAAEAGSVGGLPVASRRSSCVRAGQGLTLGLRMLRAQDRHVRVHGRPVMARLGRDMTRTHCRRSRTTRWASHPAPSAWSPFSSTATSPTRPTAPALRIHS